MSARSTKGLKIYLSKGSAKPNELTPTAITSAKPAVVTCTATGVKDGDLVFVNGTGMPSLDNRLFVVSGATGTSITLVGSDSTADTYAAGGSETVKHYAMSDMERLCLSSITVNTDEPGTISVATYCDSTATLPAPSTSAGSVNLAGFVDITSTDYLELLAAAEDGTERMMMIALPNNGYLVAPITLSSISWDLPLEGAIAWSGTGALGSAFRHIF